MNLKKEVAVSNGNVYERILKQLSSILKMVVDGTRDPQKVAEVLQGIIEPSKKEEDIGAGTDFITHHVTVNRDRERQEVLNATGRRQYVNQTVISRMPRGEGDEVDVIFFKLCRYVNDNDLEKEYELRRLKPADPYSLAKVNEDDPAFADEHPNGTHWKDQEGKWCFAAFGRCLGERSVGVHWRGDEWNGGWWFAGLRK